jgi:mono/diheme cytochrome c family protein
MNIKFAISTLAALIVVGCQSAEKTQTAAPAVPNAQTTPARAPETPAVASNASFATVSAVLKQNCAGCHGEKGKEEVDVRTYQSLMKGGEHGPIVKPGDPENSVLIHVLRTSHGKKQMPPQSPLKEEQIKQIEAWIKAGAKES